jgi:hypothetical protein
MFNLFVLVHVFIGFFVQAGVWDRSDFDTYESRRDGQDEMNCIDENGKFQGGFVLDNQLLLCWGDSRNEVKSLLSNILIFPDPKFPITYNSLEFGETELYGLTVENIFTHYDEKGGLDVLTISFGHMTDEITYHGLNRKFKYITNLIEAKTTYQHNGLDVSIGEIYDTSKIHPDDESIALDTLKGSKYPRQYYVQTYKTPSNKIFEREYSSCDGDCGGEIYNGQPMEMEVAAFLKGRAHQEADYYDSFNKINLKICGGVFIYYDKNTGETKNLRFDHPNLKLTFASLKANINQEVH